jgi:hypothetical protein
MDVTLIVVGVIVLGIVLGGGGYLFVRLRGPKEEPDYHFQCPKCRRRLRYKAKQVGRKGQCPQCGETLTFPPISKAIA